MAFAAARHRADALKAQVRIHPPAEWDELLSHNGFCSLNGSATGGGRSTSPRFRNSSRCVTKRVSSRIVFRRGSRRRNSANGRPSEAVNFVLKCGGGKMYFDQPATRILLEHKRAWVEDMTTDDDGAAWR